MAKVEMAVVDIDVFQDFRRRRKAATHKKLIALVKQMNPGESISAGLISRILNGEEIGCDKIVLIATALEVSYRELVKPSQSAAVPSKSLTSVVHPRGPSTDSLIDTSRIEAGWNGNGHSAETSTAQTGEVSNEGQCVRRQSVPSPIVEYLYIDHSRLNSYFEQIEASSHNILLYWQPSPHQKSDAHNSFRARSHEKLDLLKKHLLATDQYLAIPSDVEAHLSQRTHPTLEDGPHLTPLGEAMKKAVFHEITIQAVKLFVPGSSVLPDSPGITVWISTDEAPFRLFLFQDSLNVDDEPECHSFSSFTIWQMLYSSVSGESNGWDDTDVDKDTLGWRTANSEPPMDHLKRIGSVFSKPRRIHVLYRMRYFFNSKWELHVYGYPLFISDAPETV